MKAWAWASELIYAAGVGVVATAGNILTFMVAMWIFGSGPVEPDMMSIAPFYLLLCNIIACTAIGLAGDWGRRSGGRVSGGLSVLSVTVVGLFTTLLCAVYDIACAADGYTRLNHWMLAVSGGYCAIAAGTFFPNKRKLASEKGQE